MDKDIVTCLTCTDKIDVLKAHMPKDIYDVLMTYDYKSCVNSRDKDKYVLVGKCGVSGRHVGLCP